MSNTTAIKRTILVADDDADCREILGRRLRRLGYQVVEAQNGQEALASIASSPIDLVLLDHLMPDMPGLDVLSRIRAREATASLPVIMVTGMSFSEDVDAAMALGASAYVLKPVDFPRTLALIERHLAQGSA